MIEDPKDGEPVTPCMDVYKAKIQSSGTDRPYVGSWGSKGRGYARLLCRF